MASPRCAASLFWAEAGLRLCDEGRRGMARSVGLAWPQAFGGTGALTRTAGARVAGTSLVAGLRLGTEGRETLMRRQRLMAEEAAAADDGPISRSGLGSMAPSISVVL